jgi:hypothetical protein
MSRLERDDATPDIARAFFSVVTIGHVQRNLPERQRTSWTKVNSPLLYLVHMSAGLRDRKDAVRPGSRCQKLSQAPRQ